MKKFSKILSVALLVALVFSLGISSAFAEGNTITMDSSAGHTYSAYQIFTGKLETVDNQSVLSDIQWGSGVNGTALLNALKADTTYGAAFASCSTAADVAKALSKYTSNGDDIAALAKIIGANKTTASATGTTEITGLANGYYLIVDVTAEENMPDGNTYSDFMLEIVKDVHVTAKDATTTSDKKVKEKNDTTDYTSDWQDAADYDIGDMVPFKLSGKVASDYAKYPSPYYFAFHDVQSAGLTFNKDSVKVYLGATGETEISADYYTVKTTDLTDGCTFEIEFTDLKQVDDVEAGSIIRVEYESRLNEDAKIGSEGNPNTSHIEFSNNPYGDQHGETPDDKVVVFTYEIEALKVQPDGETTIPAAQYNELSAAEKENYEAKTVDGNTVYVAKTKALEGAGFTLYKEIKNGANVTWKQVGDEITGVTTFEFKGTDAGKYKLVETTVPAGFNKCDDIEITVSATYDTTSDNPKLKSLTVAPATAGFTVTVAETKDESENVTEITTDGVIKGKILNNKGSVLPSTGGIGTTIFYVVGGVLVLAAIILLVTKKRMSE